MDAAKVDGQNCCVIAYLELHTVASFWSIYVQVNVIVDMEHTTAHSGLCCALIIYICASNDFTLVN